MVISVRELTKVYRTYQKDPGFMGAVRGLWNRRYRELTAANRVSFEIGEGELVGFLGPNGAGKTTTLKMLAGLMEPSSGTARVLGFTPWERKKEFRRKISLVLGQKNQLWWDLPARESFSLNQVIYGLDAREAQATVDELTAYLDVRDKLDTLVRELSLGERMKMELIAALLHKPRVLFLDEPTIGLDVVSQKKVRDFLGHYAREKRITTILTSHYMQDIEQLCSRVIIIDHGTVFFDGPWQNITGRFADVKIVTLKFNPMPPGTAWERYGEVVESDAASVTLKVSRSQAAELNRAALAMPGLEDIGISPVPVEDVIRDLFQKRAVPVS
jgi:ABC-2 type transport system ATP-binding protein